MVEEKTNILNKVFVFGDNKPGFVELIDVFGDELTVVNAARVSFGSESKSLSSKDTRLLNYLFKHKHMSPFRHVQFRFRIKAPEFVMRQWYKHVVGIETTSLYHTKSHAWSEISGRYKVMDSFYTPVEFFKQSTNSKQGSGVTHDDQAVCNQLFEAATDAMVTSYDALIKMGVAKEQARMVLPLTVYTEIIWTCSLEALVNFIHLRDHPEAQLEIRLYAEQMKRLFANALPVLYNIFFN